MSGTDRGTVIVVVSDQVATELAPELERHGYAVERIADLGLVPARMRLLDCTAGVILERAWLGMKDIMTLATCRELRPALVLILLSQHASTSDLKRGLETGATAVLPRPWNPITVVDTLDRAASHRSA